MVRILFLCFALFGVGLYAQDAPKKNVFSNAGDATKMSLAKQKMYAGEFTSAVSVYKELEKNNPKNSSIKYYVAYCQVQLNQKPQAKARRRPNAMKSGWGLFMYVSF